MADETLFEQLKGYDFVKITYPDMHGIPRGVSTASRNLRNLLESGTYAWRGKLIKQLYQNNFVPKCALHKIVLIVRAFLNQM